MKIISEFLVLGVWLVFSETPTSERGQEIKIKIINYRATKISSL
jgi:hypothetical protein